MRHPRRHVTSSQHKDSVSHESNEHSQPPPTPRPQAAAIIPRRTSQRSRRPNTRQQPAPSTSTRHIPPSYEDSGESEVDDLSDSSLTAVDKLPSPPRRSTKASSSGKVSSHHADHAPSTPAAVTAPSTSQTPSTSESPQGSSPARKDSSAAYSFNRERYPAYDSHARRVGLEDTLHGKEPEVRGSYYRPQTHFYPVHDTSMKDVPHVMSFDLDRWPSEQPDSDPEHRARPRQRKAIVPPKGDTGASASTSSSRPQSAEPPVPSSSMHDPGIPSASIGKITLGPDPAFRGQGSRATSPEIRYILGMHPDEPVTLQTLEDPPAGKKPNYPYPTLITLAIHESPRKSLTLQEIYQALETRFDWYKNHPDEKSWHNSIRHNLSLNKRFRRVTRSLIEGGKGCRWVVDLSGGEGTKRPRKRNRPTKQPRLGHAALGPDADAEAEAEVEAGLEVLPATADETESAGPSTHSNALTSTSPPANRTQQDVDMVAPDSPEVVTRILGSPQSDTHHMSSSPSPGPHVPQSPPSRPETPPTPHVPFASSQLPHTPRVRIRSVSVDDHHHEAHQGWVPTESRQGAHYTPSYMPAQARSASQPRLVPCTDYDSDDSDHPFVPNSASPTRGSFSSRSSSSSRSAGLDSSPVSYEQSARRSTLHRDDSAERRQTYQPHPPHAPNVHSCPTCGSSAAPLPSPHHYQHHHYPPPTPVYPPAYLPEHARASVPPYYPPPPIPYALTHASQDYPAVAPAPHAYYPPHSHPHPSYYPPPAPAHAADDPHVAQGHEVASSLGRRQRRVYTDSRGTAYPKRGRVDDYSSSDSSESSADE